MRHAQFLCFSGCVSQHVRQTGSRDIDPGQVKKGCLGIKNERYGVLLLIHPPNGTIQNGSEGDPNEIGNEKQAGGGVLLPEDDGCRQYRCPEQKNLGKGQIGFVQAEKNPRPESVKNKLGDKQR